MSTENSAIRLKHKTRDLLSAVKSDNIHHGYLLKTYLNPYIKDLENFGKENTSDPSLRDLQEVLKGPLQRLRELRDQYRKDVVFYLETRDPARGESMHKTRPTIQKKIEGILNILGYFI